MQLYGIKQLEEKDSGEGFELSVILWNIQGLNSFCVRQSVANTVTIFEKDERSDLGEIV